jgi:SHS2 domain-containing protein
MSRPPRGHEEVPHTADWALRVWAENLPALFAEAAKGMYALSGVRLAPGPRISRTLELEASDEEGLLVAFLSELLYLQEQDNLGFDEHRLAIEGPRLGAVMKGASLVSVEKPIKAVTFHNLHIQQTGQGCEVQLVFDV